MGPIGCAETSVSSNLRFVTSRKSEDVIYKATKARNHQQYRHTQFVLQQEYETVSRPEGKISSNLYMLIRQCIWEKRGAQNIVKELKQYQEKWLQHVKRMDTNRIPKQALQYKPKGRRNIGRPRKRWRDQLHLEDQGAGNTPNTS